MVFAHHSFSRKIARVGDTSSERQTLTQRKKPSVNTTQRKRTAYLRFLLPFSIFFFIPFFNSFSFSLSLPPPLSCFLPSFPSPFLFSLVFKFNSFFPFFHIFLFMSLQLEEVACRFPSCDKDVWKKIWTVSFQDRYWCSLRGSRKATTNIARTHKHHHTH